MRVLHSKHWNIYELLQWEDVSVNWCLKLDFTCISVLQNIYIYIYISYTVEMITFLDILFIIVTKNMLSGTKMNIYNFKRVSNYKNKIICKSSICIMGFLFLDFNANAQNINNVRVSS